MQQFCGSGFISLRLSHRLFDLASLKIPDMQINSIGNIFSLRVDTSP